MVLGERMKKAGYMIGKDNEKLLNLFHIAGMRETKSIPSMLITGMPGAGKTSLAECFASAIGAKCFYVQCYPGMGSDNFYSEPNIEAIIRNDSLNAIKKGILIKAIEATTDGDVVLILDELDKSRKEVDSFLLDFIQNGRISTGQEIYRRSDGNIWMFATSNNERELSSALGNRLRKLEIQMDASQFLEILDLPEDHYLGEVYNKDSNFSVRQGKMYLDDLKFLNTDYDIDVLSQYLSKEIQVDSLQDMKLIQNENYEVQFMPLSTKVWSLNENLLNIEHIEYDHEENEYFIYPKTPEEIKILLENDKSFDGWFNVSNRLNQKDIRWLNNDGILYFGIYVADGKMFKIVEIKENTKIYFRSCDIRKLKSIKGFEIFESYESDNYEED